MNRRIRQTGRIGQVFQTLLVVPILAVLLPASVVRAEESSKVLFKRESQYAHIIVEQEGKRRTMYFRRHRVDYSETAIDMDDTGRLVMEHTRLMMAGLAFTKQPRRVLMIGLGGGIVVRVMARHYRNCIFENVELDPVVVMAAKRYFGFRPNAKMKVAVQDGRVYLRRTKQRYDMIILDAYRGGFIPFHLKTEEFLTMVRDHLNPGGIVVANLHFGTKLYDADRATYDAVFEQVYAFHGAVDANVILVAHQGSKRLTKQQLEQRAEQLQKRYRFSFDLPAQVRFYRPRDRYNRRAKVLTDDHAPVGALNKRRR